MPIGQAGYFLDVESHLASIAYLIDEPFQGRGYATEVLGILVARHLDEHPDFRLMAVIPDGHVASERVVSKLGFEPVSSSIRKEMEVRVWELKIR